MSRFPRIADIDEGELTDGQYSAVLGSGVSLVNEATATESGDEWGEGRERSTYAFRIDWNSSPDRLIVAADELFSLCQKKGQKGLLVVKERRRSDVRDLREIMVNPNKIGAYNMNNLVPLCNNIEEEMIWKERASIWRKKTNGEVTKFNVVSVKRVEKIIPEKIPFSVLDIRGMGRELTFTIKSGTRPPAAGVFIKLEGVRQGVDGYYLVTTSLLNGFVCLSPIWRSVEEWIYQTGANPSGVRAACVYSFDAKKTLFHIFIETTYRPKRGFGNGSLMKQYRQTKGRGKASRSGSGVDKAAVSNVLRSFSRMSVSHSEAKGGCQYYGVSRCLPLFSFPLLAKMSLEGLQQKFGEDRLLNAFKEEFVKLGKTSTSGSRDGLYASISRSDDDAFSVTARSPWKTIAKKGKD